MTNSALFHVFIAEDAQKDAQEEKLIEKKKPEKPKISALRNH
jgi:hypothetical protein